LRAAVHHVVLAGSGAVRGRGAAGAGGRAHARPPRSRRRGHPAARPARRRVQRPLSHAARSAGGSVASRTIYDV
jgi:hypothetical protein